MPKLVLIVVCLPLFAFTAGVSLPAPGGPYRVGRTSFSSGHESAILWYPAQRSGKRSPYASSATLSHVPAGYYGQSAATVQSWANVNAHASESATPRDEPSPLLIFLPGQGVYGFQYSSLAEDFASRGYIVAVLDYFSQLAPERTYSEDDPNAVADDMAHAGIALFKSLAADAQWSRRIRMTQVAAAGHSIGGAAAIAMCRLDGRIRGAIDMDGAPFGLATQGAVSPVLVLRSRPVYSDADLAKRGRTREQMDKMGEAIAHEWAALRAKSGDATVRVLSVRGAGHMSFSDSPFVMPDTITRFGGEMIAPQRGYAIITTCVAEFLDGFVRGKPTATAGKQCSSSPEVVEGAVR